MKYRTVLLWLLLVGLTSLGSCSLGKSDAGKHEQKEAAMSATSNVVAIASIGSVDDDTRRLVRQLLLTEHIKATFSGSIVHHVFVPEHQAQEAQAILKRSLELKGRWIKYLDLGGHSK